MQIFHHPFRHLAIVSMLVVMIGLAGWPSGPIHAQPLAPQATTITITQWLGFINDSGARQSSQSPYNAAWYVAVAIIPSNGENIHGLSEGTLTFFYDGHVNGTFRNAAVGGPYKLVMPSGEVGNHLFQATYTGDSTYAASSAQATHTIIKANVGLTIDSSSTFTYAPSAPLKLIVRSQVGIPAGEVLKFLINGSLVYSFPIPAGPGTAPVPVFAINEDNNSVVPVKAPSTAGMYRLSIAYGGDRNILAGSSPTYQIRVTATGASTPLPTATGHATPTPANGVHPGTPSASPIGDATPPPVVDASSTSHSPASSPARPSGGFLWWIVIALGVGGVGGLGIVWRAKLKGSK